MCGAHLLTTAEAQVQHGLRSSNDLADESRFLVLRSCDRLQRNKCAHTCMHPPLPASRTAPLHDHDVQKGGLGSRSFIRCEMIREHKGQRVNPLPLRNGTTVAKSIAPCQGRHWLRRPLLHFFLASASFFAFAWRSISFSARTSFSCCNGQGCTWGPRET